MNEWADATSVLTLVVFLVYMAALTHLLSEQLGRSHPATYYPGFWAAILLVSFVGGLRIYPPSAMALGIIAAGVTAFSVGASVVGRIDRPRAPAPRPTHPINLGISMAALSTMFVVGAATFRAGVESATGAAFDQLDARSIRYAQNYLEASGGPYALFFSLGVVLVPLLVLAGRNYSRLFYVLILPVMGAIVQSPARSYALAVAGATLAFSLYQRSTPSVRPRLRASRVLSLVLVSMGAAAAYFVSVGASLGKGQGLQGASNSSWLPDWLEGMVLYFAGGVSALSVAVESGGNPSRNAFGRSASVVFRVLSEILPGITTPETIAPSSYIPVEFNLYTAPGDLWFDFGWVGVVGVFFCIGVSLGLAHDRATGGDLGAMFVAALLVSSLVATPLNLNILTIQTLFLLITGWLVFRSLSWGTHLSARSASQGGQHRPA